MWDLYIKVSLGSVACCALRSRCHTNNRCYWTFRGRGAGDTSWEKGASRLRSLRFRDAALRSVGKQRQSSMALGGSECWNFTVRPRYPRIWTRRVGVWVGPRNELGTVMKRKPLVPNNHRQTLSSHVADWAIPTLFIMTYRKLYAYRCPFRALIPDRGKRVFCTTVFSGSVAHLSCD